jgi:predicted ATPase
MLSALTIEGFKRFANENFALRELTILAGMNGTGKTSVIHALLLMQEACRRRDGNIELNGPYDLELGTFSNLQNWNVPENMRFTTTDHHAELAEWAMSGDPDALFARVTLPNKAPDMFNKQGRTFQYLSAERLGPRVISSCGALPLELMNTGHRGQFSAQLFHSEDKLKLDFKRCTPETTENDSHLLRPQTELWLSRIARPIAIDSEALPFAGAAALRFRIPDGEWVRPTNMGFGVSYALPIILAGLTAAEGGLLIIENPEAHLHPSGQSEMGRFLATISAAGVQVIVETHSDHVLNGIRRAIGEHQILRPEQALLHFFGHDQIGPHTLEFTERGGVSEWPPGFFDQFQIDVSALTRVRRPKS